MREEKKIQQKLKEGDPETFDLIFEKYHRKVYAFTLRNLRNKEDAEGAVQEVFYNLWKDRANLKELNDIEAWIFTICLNIIRKHFRRLAIEKKHLALLMDQYIDRDDSTVAELEYKDLLEKTGKIIKNLPSRQKTIFLLSREEALSNFEISQKLKISVRTVDNQLSKVNSFLRKALIDRNILSLLYFCLLSISATSAY